MSKFIPGPPDAELALQASTTKTANYQTAWLDLGVGFAPGGLGMPLAGVVNVSALDLANSNETYAFTLQEADADASGQPDAATVRSIGAAVSAAAVGIVLAKGLATTRFVRLSLVVGGTTPSVTFAANLNP